MQTRALHSGKNVRVVEYACSARRGERPFQEAHKSMSVALVKSGVFTYRTESTREVLGPGDFLLGNAGESYECLHEHTDGDLCTCFEFSESAVESVASTLKIKAPRLKAREGRGRKALPMKVTSELASSSMEELGLSLLATLLSEDEEKQPTRLTAQQQRRMGDVQKLMDERFDDELCLDDFAAIAKLSPYHFLRVFRAHVGMTPHQYLTRLRLMRSAEKLLASAESVTEVAYASGFRDLSHFMHVFKASFGQSPRRFRTARNPKSTSA